MEANWLGNVRAAGWIRRALAMVLLFGLGGCSTAGPRPATPEIVRLDGTTIDSATLTARIEDLTRAAAVQGLTVTVFNDAQAVYSRAFGFAGGLRGNGRE